MGGLENSSPPIFVFERIFPPAILRLDINPLDKNYLAVNRARRGVDYPRRNEGSLADETKNQTAAGARDGGAERRRSHRVHIAMKVLVRGTSESIPFREESQTISVNAHGCMVRLAARVTRGQRVTIINGATAEELDCTVTFTGQKESGKTEIGLEFSEPSPVFWRIAFPPEDWDPTERKRPNAGGPRPEHRPLPKK